MSNIHKTIGEHSSGKLSSSFPKQRHFREEREGPLRVPKILSGVNKFKTLSIITLGRCYLFLLSYLHMYTVEFFGRSTVWDIATNRMQNQI